MQRTAVLRAAQNQTTGTIFIVRVFFDDLSCKKNLNNLFCLNAPFDAALNGMLSPPIGIFMNEFLNGENIYAAQSWW